MTSEEVFNRIGGARFCRGGLRWATMLELHGDPSEDPQPPDYPLSGGATTTGAPTGIRRTRWSATWVLGALLVFAIVVAALVVARNPGTAVPPRTDLAQTQQPPAEPARPLGGTPAAVSVPPLDRSDAVVRDLVSRLTTHPTVAAWLTTDDLVRNLVVSVANAADGITPARHLRRLRPAEPFTPVEDGERLVIAPASYHRYDRFAAALASVDPDGAARLYATLKPRLEEAYRELGRPETSFDEATERVIVQLLRTPVLDRPLVIQPGLKGIGFVYTDGSLEALSGAQKQLLRMGPDNVRAVQRSLRAFADALGIPATRLPKAAE